MAAPLPVTGVKFTDFSNLNALRKLVTDGGLSRIPEDNLGNLLRTVKDLVARFQSRSVLPEGAEQFLDALSEKARLTRLKVSLGTDLPTNEERILANDELWKPLTAYIATKRGREKYAHIDTGSARPK